MSRNKGRAVRQTPIGPATHSSVRYSADPVFAVEPYAAALPDERGSFGNAVLADTEHAVQDADVIVLLTDYTCFRSIRKDRADGKVIRDTRGRWA
jgi:UDP-N-acetyl-D-mannosaminuronic acid dehydrogenase